MTDNAWPPHLTVATVVRRGQEFLFVEETDNLQTVFNQPAGHVEPNETVFAAAVRETLEETGWEVALTGFVGVYQYYSAHNDTTYLRICFTAEAVRDTGQELDADIIKAHWMKRDDLQDLNLRSPLVAQCLEDALQRPNLPLDLVRHVV